MFPPGDEAAGRPRAADFDGAAGDPAEPVPRCFKTGRGGAGPSRDVRMAWRRKWERGHRLHGRGHRTATGLVVSVDEAAQAAVGGVAAGRLQGGGEAEAVAMGHGRGRVDGRGARRVLT